MYEKCLKKLRVRHARCAGRTSNFEMAKLGLDVSKLEKMKFLAPSKMAGN